MLLLHNPKAPGRGSEVTASEEIAKMELPKAIPEDVKQIIGNWKGILSQLTGITKTYLNKAVPTLGPNNCLLLVFEDPNAYEYISENRFRMSGQSENDDCRADWKRSGTSGETK